MTKLICAALVTFSLVAIPLEVSAQENYPFQTGNDFLSQCEVGSDALSEAYCLGYIAGLVDRDAVAQGLNEGAGMICLPEESNLRQSVDVVLEFLRETPEVRHESARILALIALGRAFPCAG